MSKESFLLFEQIKNDKNVFNKAKLIKQLIEEKGLRIKEIADKTGYKQSYICHLLRLNNLPEIVADSYYADLINPSHLFVLSRLKKYEDIISVYEKILKDSLSVARTEELVREILYSIQSSGQRVSKNEISEVEKVIEEAEKGVRLKVVQTRIKAKIIMEMKGDLETTSQFIRRILKKLMGERIVPDEPTITTDIATG